MALGCPRPRVVVRFDIRDRRREHYWLLLHKPAAELCVKPPGFDEDLIVTTDSQTLTMVHMGRLDPLEATRAGKWRVEGPTALVRGLPTWGGLRSRFAAVRPMAQTSA